MAAEFTPEKPINTELLSGKLNFPFYSLAQLPDADAQDVFVRILEAEKLLASADLTTEGYIKGSACIPDEMSESFGDNGVILTAEHATDQRRLRNGERRRKEADWGTGGLAAVLAEDTNTTALIAVGMQTGDPNDDPKSKFKTAMGMHIATQLPGAVTSLHGMPSNKIADPSDERTYDVAIGIGAHPNEQTEATADLLKRLAAELGLRAGINQPFIKIGGTNIPIRKPDGTLETFKFAASGANTTRSFAEGELAKLGLASAAVQVELSSNLRLTPFIETRDLRRHVMGMYLGYELMRRFLDGLAKK